MDKSSRFRAQATDYSPVTDVPGIGPVYGSRLNSQGIYTVGDLRRLQEDCSDREDFIAKMKSMADARCDHAGNTYDALKKSSARISCSTVTPKAEPDCASPRIEICNVQQKFVLPQYLFKTTNIQINKPIRNDEEIRNSGVIPPSSAPPVNSTNAVFGRVGQTASGFGVRHSPPFGSSDQSVRNEIKVVPPTAVIPAQIVNRPFEFGCAINQSTANDVSTAVVEPKTTSLCTFACAAGKQQSAITGASSQSATKDSARSEGESKTVTLPASNKATAFGAFFTPSVPESKPFIPALPSSKEKPTVVSAVHATEAKTLFFPFGISATKTTVTNSSSTTKDSPLSGINPKSVTLPSAQPVFGVFPTPSVPEPKLPIFSFAAPSSKRESTSASVSPASEVQTAFGSSDTSQQRKQPAISAVVKPDSNKTYQANPFSFGTFAFDSVLSTASTKKANDKAPTKSNAIKIDREQFAETKLILKMMTDEILTLNRLTANQRISPVIEKSASILKFLAKQIMSKETQTMLEDINAAISDTNEQHND